MNQRTAEATRLEQDYIARLRAALAGRAAGTAEEIVGGVRDHIEEALAEQHAEEVTLVRMAMVLERLGPPEAWAADSDSTASAGPATAAPPANPSAAVSGLTAADRGQLATLFGRVWWANLITIIGLFIPVIELHLCSIIGLGIEAWLLLNLPVGGIQQLRTAGRLAKYCAVLTVAILPVTLLTMLHPGFALIGFPVHMALLVLSVISYWMLLEGAVQAGNRIGDAVLEDGIRRTRAWGIAVGIVMIVLLMVVGIAAGASRWWVGLALLPLSWLYGWAFVLRPLGWIEAALRRS